MCSSIKIRMTTGNLETIQTGDAIPIINNTTVIFTGNARCESYSMWINDMNGIPVILPAITEFAEYEKKSNTHIWYKIPRDLTIIGVTIKADKYCYANSLRGSNVYGLRIWTNDPREYNPINKDNVVIITKRIPLLIEREKIPKNKTDRQEYLKLFIRDKLYSRPLLFA